jgi:hypothetical protein
MLHRAKQQRAHVPRRLCFVSCRRLDVRPKGSVRGWHHRHSCLQRQQQSVETHPCAALCSLESVALAHSLTHPLVPCCFFCRLQYGLVCSVHGEAVHPRWLERMRVGCRFREDGRCHCHSSYSHRLACLLPPPAPPLHLEGSFLEDGACMRMLASATLLLTDEGREIRAAAVVVVTQLMGSLSVLKCVCVSVCRSAVPSVRNIRIVPTRWSAIWA